MHQKLEKWLRWLPIIQDEVTELVIARHVFREVQHIIASNADLQQPNSFYNFLGNAYVSHAVIGLRRQLKVDKNSISLARLFEDMIAAPEAVTRKYYMSLYRRPGMQRLASKDFDRFAVVGSSHINPSLVAADLRSFVSECARCVEFADRRVAHRDRRPPRNLPTHAELDKCIDLLDRLCVKYHLLFTAEGMKTLLPAWQYDWHAIFRVPWITR